MQKLIQANLYQPNPIEISGFLVERYNKCLELLGLMPTKLKKFTIDAKGWSPEIAKEKKKTHYLNNGDANPHAIIISPLQKGKVVYEPFHSFDTNIMQLIFDRYEAEIKDITKESALCVDFNQQIDVFYETFDLLKYDKITIHFHLIDHLEKIKNEQLQWVKEFNSANNFVNEKLHQKILTSVKKYGDLRHRNLDLKPLKYQTSSFYTKAFGGIFIFKDFANPIMVFESNEWRDKAIKNTTREVIIFHIEESQLLKTLEDYVAIHLDLDKIVTTERYQRIKNHVFAQMFSKTDHLMADILNNKLLFKNYLNKLDIQGRKRLMSVERYLESVTINKNTNLNNYITRDFLEAMYQPHSSLLDENYYLVWKLLTKIAPKDPLNMYKYDKNTFYENFVTWSDSYKDWVVAHIIENSN
ncbi:MAG: hypothetical protein L3J23_01135 [Flavobacteriaceae bacterium]|nr:hypothetical protein [Flavobacteriaceae bacterium]